MGQEETLRDPKVRLGTGRTGQAEAGKALREEQSGRVHAGSLYDDQLGAQVRSGHRTCPGREHTEKAALQHRAEGTALIPTGHKQSELSQQMNRGKF